MLSRSFAKFMRPCALNQMRMFSSFKAPPTDKVLTFFVLGGPGSGKGTLCKDLVNDHKFEHLSAGDLLRIERDSGSKTADLINERILAGKIVPVEITVGLLKNEMKRLGWTDSKFLIDGFPRNQDNFDGWYKAMGELAHVPFAIFLDCSEETMIRRMHKRRNESERDGIAVRNDDNIEVFKKRYQTFHSESMPVVEQFEKEGQLVRLDANKETDEVLKELYEKFEEIGIL